MTPLGKLSIAGVGFGAAFAALPSGLPTAELAFAQPAQVATERLAKRREVVEGTGMGSLTVERVGGDGASMLIGVTRAGEARAVTCRVVVAPTSDAASRAAIDCTQPGAGEDAMRELGSGAVAIVVAEHVAAAVEDRRYDVDGVADRLMALLITNRRAIAASVSPPRE